MDNRVCLDTITKYGDLTGHCSDCHYPYGICADRLQRARERKAVASICEHYEEESHIVLTGKVRD